MHDGCDIPARAGELVFDVASDFPNLESFQPQSQPCALPDMLHVRGIKQLVHAIGPHQDDVGARRAVGIGGGDGFQLRQQWRTQYRGVLHQDQRPRPV